MAEQQLITFHTIPLVFPCGATLAMNHQSIGMLKTAGVEIMVFEKCHGCGQPHEMGFPDVTRTVVSVEVTDRQGSVMKGGLLVPNPPNPLSGMGRN